MYPWLSVRVTCSCKNKSMYQKYTKNGKKYFQKFASDHGKCILQSFIKLNEGLKKLLVSKQKITHSLNLNVDVTDVSTDSDSGI